MMDNDQLAEGLSGELLELLGHDGFMALVEAYGGLRVYIASNTENSKLAEHLPDDVLRALANRFRGDVIRVPLAKHYRARHYRLSGMSDREIARKLGMTESGVEKLFKTVPTKRPAKRLFHDPRQIDLFQKNKTI